jgi:hypothetical protein
LISIGALYNFQISRVYGFSVKLEENNHGWPLSSIVTLHWDLGSFSMGLSRDVYATYLMDIGESDPKLKVFIDELQLERTSLKIQIMVTVDASSTCAHEKVI